MVWRKVAGKVGIKINEQRLWKTLMDLSEIGKNEGGGITRLSLSNEDMLAREYIFNLMEESGLTVRIDEVGNIIGQLSSKNPEAPIVMTGSHIDTVINGGAFDGALGVLGAIEAVRTIKENRINLTHTIEVISFTDEEGTRFGTGFIGSRGITGDLTENDLDIVDNLGETYREAFQKASININSFEKDVRRSNIKAFLEMHIEQGRVLETENIPIGIVSNIQGATWYKITLVGLADHAGATPMFLRRDPTLAMAELLLEFEKLANESGGVATVGKMEFKPGAENVIPEEVSFSLDFRHVNKLIKESNEEKVVHIVKDIARKRNVEAIIEVNEKQDPASCSKNIIKTFELACQSLHIPIYQMNCGAGHDSLLMSKITDMGMILVRSKDGISHSPLEWSSKNDCSVGTQVLMNSLIILAK